MRASSALAGVLGVWTTYALGTRLFSRASGLCAAALAASSLLLIRYSQELRAYGV